MKVTIEVSEYEAAALRDFREARSKLGPFAIWDVGVLCRLADALPREIKVGDRVYLDQRSARADLLEVAAVRSGQAWLFYEGTDAVWGTEDLSDLTLADV